MDDQTRDHDGLSDAEGARSRPPGETTATERRECQHHLPDLAPFDLASEAATLIAEARGSTTRRSSKPSSSHTIC